jgi:phosphoesterase RecJ-like protein
MIDYIRGVKGIRVAILFQECKGDVVKVGFRSKDENIDVNKIANYFGGGGHLMASGCRIKGKLEDVKRLVLRKVRAYIKEGEKGLWA